MPDASAFHHYASSKRHSRKAHGVFSNPGDSQSGASSIEQWYDFLLEVRFAANKPYRQLEVEIDLSMDQLENILSAEVAQWAVAIISLLALVRPELEALYKRFVTEVVLHPRDRLEIGFSGYGPSVGITGSIQSVSNDSLIRDINLKLVRLSDNKTHRFSLGFSRIRKITQQGETAEAELATAFTIKRGESRSIDFMFLDSSTQKRFDPELVTLREAWQNASIADGHIADLIKSNEVLSAVNEFQNEQAPIVDQSFKALERAFYWEAGKYNLSLNIITSNPEKAHTFSCNFEIGDKESETLMNNFTKIMLSLTGFPAISFEYPWVLAGC